MDVEKVSPPESNWAKIPYYTRLTVSNVLPILWVITGAIGVAGAIAAVLVGVIGVVLALLVIGVVFGVPTFILFVLGAAISPHEYEFNVDDE